MEGDSADEAAVWMFFREVPLDLPNTQNNFKSYFYVTHFVCKPWIEQTAARFWKPTNLR